SSAEQHRHPATDEDLKAAARAAAEAYRNALKGLNGLDETFTSASSGLALALVQVHKSVAALGPAMAAVDVPTSSALAASIQSTENLWRAIRDEWGLLSSSDVAHLLGAKTANRSYASDQRKAGRILGVKRGQAYAYPGFQFDHRAGKVLPVVPRLIAEARAIGLDDEDLVFWLCTQSGYFGGVRPVDRLGDQDDLIEKLRLSESVEW
ncbi:MAG TPA: hypothetical protein VHH13_09690, partial [Arthrobacter sp.]|nr:hypothetical protein [Arthrobacter sp.]